MAKPSSLGKAQLTRSTSICGFVHIEDSFQEIRVCMDLIIFPTLLLVLFGEDNFCTQFGNCSLYFCTISFENGQVCCFAMECVLSITLVEKLYERLEFLD